MPGPGMSGPETRLPPYAMPGMGMGVGMDGQNSGPAPSSNRMKKIAAVGIAAIVLSLSSGLIGGVVGHKLGGGTTTTNVTREAAPVIDRSSVAGVAASVTPSVVDITTAEGEGSGVILTADGYILTNNHVIEDSGGTLVVTFSDGEEANASVVGTDTIGDLAVIKAEGVSNLTAATFGNSSDLQIGDTVLALGSPLGLQGSVTEGIVSALNRTISTSSDSTTSSGSSISDAIQTDAAINPGNSGGPLVNLAGEVIGINTAIATASDSSGSIGLGFAIPSNKAKTAADALMAGKEVSHPYLGVQVSDGDGGALIVSVVSGGPAAEAGLQKGDLVVAIAGTSVTDADSLIAAIQSSTVGSKIEITVERDGSTLQLSATLINTPS